MTTKNELHIEYIPLGVLKKYPKNPKQHDLDTISESINRFGFNDPIALDEATGYLVEGHGRIESLETAKNSGAKPPKNVKLDKDGQWLVPVVRGISFNNPADMEAYLLAANRLTEIGGWDEKALGQILLDLKAADKLTGVGWKPREIDAFVESLNPSPDDDNLPKGRSTKAAAAVENHMRQIVLYYDVVTYEQVLDNFQSIMEAEGLDSFMEAVLHLLDLYAKQ